MGVGPHRDARSFARRQELGSGDFLRQFNWTRPDSEDIVLTAGRGARAGLEPRPARSVRDPRSPSEQQAVPGGTRREGAAHPARELANGPRRFVLQHRVMHAQRELVTTDAKILKAALDAGFGSLSRFNVAFRAACGCSPWEHRAAHRL